MATRKRAVPAPRTPLQWGCAVPADLAPGDSGHLDAHNAVHQLLREALDRIEALEEAVARLGGAG